MKLRVEYLDRARVLRGWSRADVARRAKISYNMVSDTLTGRSASPRIVLVLCRTLGVDVTDVWEKKRRS